MHTGGGTPRNPQLGHEAPQQATWPGSWMGGGAMKMQDFDMEKVLGMTGFILSLAFLLGIVVM